jgi:pyridinium-3,5-biscarboxylic acid mononucleotide synthase
MAKRRSGNPDSPLEAAVRALRAGTIDPEQFVEAVAPYAVHEVGEVAKLDGGRHARTGAHEAILAEGKDDATLAAVVRVAVSHSGRCLITRLAPERARALRRALHGMELEVHEREHAAIAHDRKTKAPRTGGKVAILTAGSSDLRAAGEARLAAGELGCSVIMFADVGVAGIHRLFPAIRKLEEAGVHAVVVAAGMDGALPSVVGGLVSVPTIGLPISTGYGVGGKGEAALLSILQSCAPGVAAVNVDNGYGAGVLAAKIANTAVRGRKSARKPRKA